MDTSSLAIACVLKSGKWHNGHIRTNYQPEHVQWLQMQCARYAPGVRFVCLTNEDKIDGVETIPLEHNWPGWWSKMELFKHDLGRVLYLDLDTVIVGPLADMLGYEHKFTACRDFGRLKTLNSSVLAWQGPRPDLFEPFAADPEYWIKTCVTGDCWGDQGFIHRHVPKWDAWQDIFPNAVGSYKNTWHRRKPPSSARLVCFHGSPKPYEVNQDWIPKL